MSRTNRGRILFRTLAVGVLAAPGWATPPAAAEETIAFNRDIRPILAEHCFACHGPDARSRKAGLRLDDEAVARGELPSGSRAIVPGLPQESELVFRVETEDPDLRMPPRKTGKPLTPRQVDRLRRWIAAGAPWEPHWSLAPIERPALPTLHDSESIRNPIDAFLLARLGEKGLEYASEADRVTLIRRLSFDLTGLPPEPEAVEAFRADDRPDAYERLVDRLLASPHHGERMAIVWLDLVRYADTVGYHSDVERSISPYRDYVIRAFNEDLPFNRFTLEQLAGDLLPGATTWQRVASAYNMLGMTTEEGGAQAKEYLARTAADRVRNASAVWMGATLGCAECHDHKFDPYSTRDFYAFAAFFADIQQPGVGTPKPTLALPTAEQEAERTRLAARIAALETALKAGGAATAARSTELEVAKEASTALDRAIRRTITTLSGSPRLTRVLHRGDWMDETGAIVEPAVPHFMRPIAAPDGRRATRLDLARWLVARDQPQTARVFVNRLWKLSFGTGLSETLEDLGTQGEWPTHPELLDWLAAEFVDSGWDVKHLVRLLVTSSAYRQSSRPRDDLKTIDPANRLLARQSSFRLEAELIRDNALAVSGLLVRSIGGESVRPYQPAGYWRFLNFPKREYVPSTGPAQYRRGLYTHWQRTLLHPSLLAFDAPSREFCTARRPISNTPQAALALLNDPTYVEAARVLAERTLREGGPDDHRRLTWIWRRVLSRPPDPGACALLAALLDQHRRDYTGDVASARALLSVGQRPADPALDPAELAAWTSVARALLNLDETITRD